MEHISQLIDFSFEPTFAALQEFAKLNNTLGFRFLLQHDIAPSTMKRIFASTTLNNQLQFLDILINTGRIGERTILKSFDIAVNNNESYRIVDRLLKTGMIDPSVMSNTVKTAAVKGYYRIVNSLFQTGMIDPDITGYVIKWAILNERIDTIKVLTKYLPRQDFERVIDKHKLIFDLDEVFKTEIYFSLGMNKMEQPVLFTSKEAMMKIFEEREEMRYFIEKGLIGNLCQQLASQTKLQSGITLAIELAMYDCRKELPEMDPFLRFVTITNIEDVLRDCVICQ